MTHLSSGKRPWNQGRHITVRSEEWVQSWYDTWIFAMAEGIFFIPSLKLLLAVFFQLIRWIVGVYLCAGASSFPMIDNLHLPRIESLWGWRRYPNCQFSIVYFSSIFALGKAIEVAVFKHHNRIPDPHILYDQSGYVVHRTMASAFWYGRTGQCRVESMADRTI